MKSNFEEVRFFLNFYNFKSFKRPPPQIYLMSGKLAVIMLRYFLFCQRTEYLLQISQHPSTIYYFFNSAEHSVLVHKRVQLKLQFKAYHLLTNMTNIFSSGLGFEAYCPNRCYFESPLQLQLN